MLHFTPRQSAEEESQLFHSADACLACHEPRAEGTLGQKSGANRGPAAGGCAGGGRGRAGADAGAGPPRRPAQPGLPAPASFPLTHLLLHLLNLLDGAAPLGPVLVPQQVHADVP